MPMLLRTALWWVTQVLSHITICIGKFITKDLRY